jgi:hypothetical protein
MRSHSMLRPVRRPLVALLAGASALCGCGGPTDSEQVRDVVQAFGQATAAKDYDRLCADVLAPDLVEEVESTGLSCEAALRQGLGEVRAPKLTVGTIEVDGARATAEVRSTASGEAPSRDTLQLVRSGEGWRIASLR